MMYIDRIVPKPQSTKVLSDHTICVGTSVVSKIHSEDAVVKNAFREISYFLSQRVCRPCVSAGTTVYLELSDAPPAEMVNPQEGYSITTSYERITVTGYGPFGLYYGVLTLISLSERHGFDQYVPHVEIHDWPASKTRGMMIDTSSDTQFTIFEDWKKTINLLSKQKMNTLFIHNPTPAEIPPFFEKIVAHGDEHCVSVHLIHNTDTCDLTGIARSFSNEALHQHAEFVWTGRK